MNVRGTILAGVIGSGLVIVACDRKPDLPVSKPDAPATPSVDVPAPATKPAEPNALFIVRQQSSPEQLLTFPPARMVVQVKDERTRVTLFSKDPVQARTGEYKGNSFWFETTFDVPSVEALPGSEFAWKNSYNERLDTNNGLFLRPQVAPPLHVQPLEAVLRIEREQERWVAYVEGTFQVFSEGIDDAPAIVWNVSSRIEPEFIVKP